MTALQESLNNSSSFFFQVLQGTECNFDINGVFNFINTMASNFRQELISTNIETQMLFRKLP